MRKYIIGTVLLAAVTTMLGVSTALATDKSMTPLDIPTIEGVKALEIGAAAPDFNIADTSKTPYKFSAKDNAATLLVFWSMFCEPCRAEMPLIQSMYQKYSPNGLKVISIAMDGGMEDSIAAFAKQEKYTFTLLVDNENLEVTDAYGIPGTPTLYIADKNGKITFSKVGRVGEDELEKALKTTLGM